MRMGPVVLDDEGKGGFRDFDGKYSVFLHRGKRRKMEDCFVAGQVSPSGTLYGVFDGHGPEGRGCADLVSKEISESVFKWDKIGNVREGFARAFSASHRKCLEEFDRGGTTACCALVQGNSLWVGNVGDSRCVLSRNGEAVPLSNDHKPNRTDERKRIEAAGGHVVYYGGWRVEGVLNISRSIGDKNLMDLLSAVPDVTEHKISEHDEFFILGSDGLWGVVDNQEAVDIVREVMNSTGGDIASKQARASEALVEAAIDKKSRDNICALVAFLRPKVGSNNAK